MLFFRSTKTAPERLTAQRASEPINAASYKRTGKEATPNQLPRACILGRGRRTKPAQQRHPLEFPLGHDGSSFRKDSAEVEDIHEAVDERRLAFNQGQVQGWARGDVRNFLVVRVVKDIAQFSKSSGHPAEGRQYLVSPSLVRGRRSRKSLQSPLPKSRVAENPRVTSAMATTHTRVVVLPFHIKSLGKHTSRVL